jgi:hypothetical protein
MNPDQGRYPVIGKDVPWDSITDMICRVIEFNPFAKMVNGKVSGQRGFPYASLIVEPEKLPGIFEIRVLSEVEFSQLWRGLIEQEADKDKEAVVLWSYGPKNGIIINVPPVLPKLEVLVYPKGSFDEKLRNPDRSNENREEEWLFI